MREDFGTAKWNQTQFIPIFVMRKEETAESKYYYIGHVDSFGASRLIPRDTSSGEASKNVTVTNLHLAEPLDTDLYRHLTGQVSV